MHIKRKWSPSQPSYVVNVCCTCWYYITTSLVWQVFRRYLEFGYLPRIKSQHSLVIEAIPNQHGSHINVKHIIGVSQPLHAVYVHMDMMLLHYHCIGLPSFWKLHWLRVPPKEQITVYCSGWGYRYRPIQDGSHINAKHIWSSSQSSYAVDVHMLDMLLPHSTVLVWHVFRR